MIDELLEIIKNEVDTFLKLKMKEGQEQYIKLAPIVDQDGKPSLNENAICMSLVKVEEDRSNMSNGGTTALVGNQVHSFNLPVRLNLYILFSGTFIDGQEKNYLEALKRLSYVISFFQARRVFTSQNTPKLDPEYGKIIMELYNQPFEEQSHFWGMFGSIYRPSVLYRLRALMVQEGELTGIHEPGRGVDFDLEAKE